MPLNINWEILLHELESGKCILCLGPDVFSENGEKRMERRLAEFLRAQASDLGIQVYDDGWFHYLEPHDELATWFAVKKFYEKNLPAAADLLLSQVAQLPFHLILNFSPDYKLRQAFHDAGRAFEFASLSKNPEAEKSRQKENVEATRAKPLIYNMLGEIEDKDSLVMTYDDLFNYMEAVFEHKRMPMEVKLKILGASHFIFLGMPLDKWYFHLFMRVINQHRNKGKTKRYAASAFFDAGNATFCEEQYTLTFVQEGIGHFVGLLSEQWQQAQAEKTGQSARSVFDQWRDWLAAADDVPMQKLFSEMENALRDDTDQLNSLLLFKMQWNGFRQHNFETEMARNAMKTQIANGILQLIQEIENRSD